MIESDFTAAPSTYSDSLLIDESKNLNDFLNNPETQAGVRFEDLNLSSELMEGLYVEMKFERPTKIQSVSLPMILTPPYKNLIAQSYKFSGKTTCFVLGMLSRVDPNLSAPQALCVCPETQSATQVMDVLLKIGKFTGITSELCLPFEFWLPADEAKYPPVSKRAPVTAQVIISTLGNTIIDMLTEDKLDTSNLKILVFQEANPMLAEEDDRKLSVNIMKEIVRWSPKCQALLFSTTFDDNVKAFVSTIVRDLFVQEFHQLIVEKEEKPCLDSVKLYKVDLLDELSKIMVLKDKVMYLGDGIRQTCIFVRSRKSVGPLHEALVEAGYAVTTIIDFPTLRNENKINKELKDGSIQVLITTDYLARMFDLSQVNLVVNYDLPVKYGEPVYEAYLHCLDVAALFGRNAAVFNLLCGYRATTNMEKIERHFNLDVTQVRLGDEDFEDALKEAGLMGFCP